MAQILVVDDAAFMRMKFKKLLTANGYQVVEASTGVEAVAQYSAEQPDAVFSILRCLIWTASRR
jgi:two-component system chemotaxis response regulator CheY